MRNATEPTEVEVIEMKPHSRSGTGSRSGRETYQKPVRDLHDEAWFDLYRQSGNPVVAKEVVTQFNQYDGLKEKHMALYIGCQITLRRHRLRRARWQRIGNALRSVISGTVILADTTLTLFKSSLADVVKHKREQRVAVRLAAEQLADQGGRKTAASTAPPPRKSRKSRNASDKVEDLEAKGIAVPPQPGVVPVNLAPSSDQ